MNNTALEPFYVIGLSVKTSNQDMQDIAMLWGKFTSKGIYANIPNKNNGDIYCIYTNYEGDHTQPYEVVLGCKVNAIDNIPDGLVSHKVVRNSYQVFSAKGDLTTGQAVGQKWMEIWEADLNRNFKSDFELYSAETKDPKDGVVEIYVGVD